MKKVLSHASMKVKGKVFGMKVTCIVKNLLTKRSSRWKLSKWFHGSGSMEAVDVWNTSMEGSILDIHVNRVEVRRLHRSFIEVLS